MIDVSRGGNLSTDYSVVRPKQFQPVLKKIQYFTGSL